jgi:hypothetical protein
MADGPDGTAGIRANLTGKIDLSHAQSRFAEAGFSCLDSKQMRGDRVLISCASTRHPYVEHVIRPFANAAR